MQQSKNEQEREEEYEALQETYRKIDESFGQFLFLLFIPNSWMNTVDVYIDEGEFRSTFTIPEFLKKIETTCGYTEANRLRIACNNLGIPFFYDRQKKNLVELKEKPKNERMSVSLIKRLSAENDANMDDGKNESDRIFDSLKGQYDSLIHGLVDPNMKQ